MSLKISLPDNCDMKPKITLFGVGGAGGNAVANMIEAETKLDDGVECWVLNTDAQALENSIVKNRIQLGIKSTKGLGAGSHPEVGKAAAEESIGDITHILENTNMVFITAGMGGGTGTGAAPVIAKQAKEMGILTVGVVTKPFHFEGARRMKVAELGLEELNKFVDTLIVIPNQNLFRIANENTTFADAFKMADNVLHSGVRGITDLITMPGLINLDFADIRSVMSEMGKAMMGTGEGAGEGRAVLAAEAAISNPLLDNTSMKGARGVLINITGGGDMTLFEVDAAANRIKEEVDPNANIIFGSAFNPNLEGKIRVSVVATGIDARTNVSLKHTVVSEIERPTPVLIKNPVQEKPEEDAEGSFMPPRPVEPNLFQNNPFSFAEDEVISEKKPEIKNSFEEEIQKSSEAVMAKLPANDTAEAAEEEAAVSKNKEDFFDIPAFLRKKMRF